jgi:tetratricopeptide (TPR) repeat protein
MEQDGLKNTESMLLDLERQVSFGQDLDAGKMDMLVSSFEDLLALDARPPCGWAVELAERAVSLLHASREKSAGVKAETRPLTRWLSCLYQAMQLREEALREAGMFHTLTGEKASRLERADALIFLAKACYWSDDQRGAVSCQRKALDLLDEAREAGELSSDHEKRYNTAYTVCAFRYAQNTCRWTEAYAAFEEAVRKARIWKDPGLLSAALTLYAEARMFQGDWERCEALARECALAALKEPNGPQNDYPFWIWGRALVQIGQAGQSVGELERSISLARKIGDAVGLSEALISRAEAHLALGEKDEARLTAARAEEVARYARLGINLSQVRIWRSWIEMAIDPGASSRFIGPLHESLAEFERLGCCQGWAAGLAALGHALALSGAGNEARFYLERAITAFQEWEMPWHEARARESLSKIAGK